MSFSGQTNAVPHNGSTSFQGSVPNTGEQDLDVLVVGAGFAGIHQLKHLRDLGYKVRLVDNGSDYGGTWHWNRFPGIRVDTAAPNYQYTDPDLRKDFTYTQRFPGGAEIQKYLKHVAERWDLRKDTTFDTYIESAEWDNHTCRWLATSSNGLKFSTKFLVLCIGCLTHKFTPVWKGVDTYKGQFIHPASWPRDEPDFKGKKVAIIGTGATAVQILQELANVAGHITVFQRTPNTALPMIQVEYNGTNKGFSEEETRAALAVRLQSFGGFDYNFLPRGCFDDTPEQRRETYEQLWQEGDFKYWLGGYNDTFFSEESNRECYNFWRDKTRPRIKDPKVADLLVPMEPPYAFGTKRIPLEQGFYEIFNEPHVRLVDLRTTPIEEFTESGIRTTAEAMDFDVVIAATGYDALTGALTRIDLKGKDGVLLRDRWKDGVKTHLGMASHNFPNMFIQFGPQAPTILCNGPACAEMQGGFVIDTINYCRDNNISTIETTREAEIEWREEVLKLAGANLMPKTDSWYVGSNIPGKQREPLMYLGGVPKYYATLNATHDEGYPGFVLKGAGSASQHKL